MRESRQVSVIIPSYNRASLIRAAAQSVLSQTYPDITLIIVDDCSDDDTEAAVKSIGDARVRYFRMERNCGACAARNKGIELAAGAFIAFNDSDDQWLPDKIERQLEFLEKNCADIVLCKMECRTPDGKLTRPFPNLDGDRRLSYQELLRYNAASTQTMLGRAECFREVRFDERMPRLQDWDEILRLSRKFSVFYQNEILVHTFFQNDSISARPEKGAAAMERLFEKHRDAILSDRAAAESFFRKKAAFMTRAGLSAVRERTAAFRARPSLMNFARLLRDAAATAVRRRNLHDIIGGGIN